MMSHDPEMKRRSRHGSLRAFCALAMLSLAACDSDDPMGELGTIQAEYGGEWEYLSDAQWGVLSSPEEVNAPEVSLLVVCGSDTANSKGLIDDLALCLRLRLDTALLGTGPIHFVIDGVAEVPLGFSPQPTFTSGATHTQGVQTVWARTDCYEGDQQADTLSHEVTGTLELRVNDATRFAGRLFLDVSGPTSGKCSTQKAHVDVEFDLPR